jgi:hypothetical protein
MAALIDVYACDESVWAEIKAWNKILKYHLGQQQKQQGLWEKDYYVYDEESKKVVRMKYKRR